MRWKNAVFLYLYIGLAFLLWENLVGSILGIHGLGLRRIIWGVVYYCLLFLVFGGMAEGINFLHRRIYPRQQWSGQRYVWFLTVLVIFLWGDASRQLLITILDLQSERLSYVLNLVWLPSMVIVGWLCNLFFFKLASNNKLPNPFRMVVYFSAAIFYLIVSTKVSYRYFQYDVFSIPNLLLQPIFVLSAWLLAVLINKVFISKRFLRWAFIILPVVFTVVVMGFSSVINNRNKARSHPEFPPTDHPNIIIMLFDALRADHVGAINAECSLTPTIDSLAARGRAYNSCYSTASYSFPAVVSLMTSILPNKLGLLQEAYIPQDIPMLPKMLNKNGYYTACLSTNSYISPTFGFDRFFDEYHLTIGKGTKQLFLPYKTFFPYPWFLNELAYQFGFISTEFISANAEELNQRAAKIMEKSQVAPVFLYMHFLEPHEPYYSMPFNEGILNLEKLKLFYDLYSLKSNNQAKEEFVEKNGKFFADTQHERYENGVRTADRAVGVMMENLQRLGISKNTIVIIMADHGEEFMEHGVIGHKSSLFEQQVRIPLIIFVPEELNVSLPDQPAGVSMVDIAPTILDLAGIDPKILGGDGWSLLQTYPEEYRPRYLMFSKKGGFMNAVVMGSYKLILVDSTGIGYPDTLLFNLSVDKAERINLYPQEKYIADSLAAYLQEQLDQSVSSVRDLPRRPNPIDSQRLRALGYVQ